jgi:general secretion pathway protein A
LICLILQSFELEADAGVKSKNIDFLYQFCIEKYAQNRPVLLIIDEAQNLSDEALEEVRMLSNLQGDDQSLIQIMLVGQPELMVRLKKPGHSAFSQRIAVNFFLSRLTDTETESYIKHRLKKAGGDPNIFTPKAIEKIFDASKGIPRTINLLCDASLVYGFGYELETIDAPVIEQVIKDKGGLGLNTENEKQMSSFSLYDEHGVPEANEDRLQRLEDVVLLMKRHVDYSLAQMKKLDEKIKVFQENLDGTLKDMLVKERNRNNKLMESYLKLKLKHDYLMKLWKEKKETTSSEDNSDIIQLKPKSRGTD